MKMLLSAALLLALSFPAFAEMPGQGPVGGGGHPGPGMGMSQDMCPMMGMHQRAEGMLAFLKTELKIAAAQTNAWDVFAAAYREAKGGQMPVMQRGKMGDGKAVRPLPERMAQRTKMMEDHLAQMKKMQAAVTQLYASLGVDQKRAADELLPMFMMSRMM